MRVLLDAVETVLLEQGFAGLHTNEIARQAGKDKNLIRYYFGSLNGLLKAYIVEKDYWLPFLERYQRLAEARPGQLRDAFIDMMQEDLRAFATNREMQQLIRWQLSEANPLMRAVSASRELQGDSLFRLTDAVFRGSDVHFRSVIALVLGGIYYTVLQVTAGNGPVCGVDVALDNDRQALLRTIGQVITWAWDAASGIAPAAPMAPAAPFAHDNQDRPMNDALTRLRNADDFDGAANELETATIRQLLGLTSPTQVQTYLQLHVAKAVALADTLLATEPRKAERLATLVETVVSPIVHHLPAGFPLPEAIRRRELAALETQRHTIQSGLQRQDIDPALTQCCLSAFDRFAGPRATLPWTHLRYLTAYADGVAALLAEGGTDNWKLIDRLVGLGYNHVRFCARVVQLAQEGLAAANPAERLAMLRGYRKRIQQIPLLTLQVYDSERPRGGRARRLAGCRDRLPGGTGSRPAQRYEQVQRIDEMQPIGVLEEIAIRPWGV